MNSYENKRKTPTELGDKTRETSNNEFSPLGGSST